MKVRSFLSTAIPFAAAFGLSACFSSGDPEASSSARAKAIKDWNLELEWEGESVQIPLERMDIYLVEDYESDPEIFEIWGDEAVLVGQFPLDLHVGYEEDLDLLKGRSIPIQPSGGDPTEPKSSFLQVGGSVFAVEGGALRFDKITGEWNGSEGDRTAWGTVELRVRDGSELHTLSGKIAVHVVSWG